MRDADGPQKDLHVQHAWHDEIAGVGRFARHFAARIHTREGFANRIVKSRLLIFVGHNHLIFELPL
jgi:hypothetical protein